MDPTPSSIEAKLERLFAKRSDHIVPGLERMKQAMAELNWDSSIPTILVAGTNGKGTVAGCLFRFCTLVGMRVGLYTSPHLRHFSERIQLSHRPTNDAELVTVHDRLTDRLNPETFAQLSFFESTTLLALEVFRSEQVDLQILEVGLGGRLDATNAVEPIAACVTSIDFDHTEWLGNTLAEIATEKLGVSRAHTPLFWLEDQESTTQKGLDQVLATTGDRTQLMRKGVQFARRGDAIELSFPEQNKVHTPIPSHVLARGSMFINSFVGAASMFWWLLTQKNLLLGRQQRSLLQNFQQAITKFASAASGAWPSSFASRQETVHIDAGSRQTKLILDVAHNPAAIRALLDGLSETPCAILCGFLADKDVAMMLNLIESMNCPVYLFGLNSQRALDLKSEVISKHLSDDVRFADFPTLWHSLHDSLHSLVHSAPVVVCGSFVAVGEVLEYFYLPTSPVLFANARHTVCRACLAH